LFYFSHGVIIRFVIIRAIRVPRVFRLFLQRAKDEMFNNFPKVGNMNFTDGKNLLYWGIDKQKTTGGDPVVCCCIAFT